MRKKRSSGKRSLTPLASGLLALFVSSFIITVACLGIYAGTYNDYTRSSDLLMDLDSIDKTVVDNSYGEVKITDPNFADRMGRIDSLSNSFEYRGNRIAFGLFWFALPMCIAGYVKWGNLDEEEKFVYEEEEDGVSS